MRQRKPRDEPPRNERIRSGRNKRNCVDGAKRKRNSAGARRVRQRKPACGNKRKHVSESESARQREREQEDARRRSQAAVVSEEAFDTYAVLGVPKDASKEAIGMAYLEARSKYDLDHVSHLGVELQKHYKARARAVDRAYQMLTK